MQKQEQVQLRSIKIETSQGSKMFPLRIVSIVNHMDAPHSD